MKKVLLLIAILGLWGSHLHAITWPIQWSSVRYPQPSVAQAYGDWQSMQFHDAIDIPTLAGKPVVAVMSGKVVRKRGSGQTQYIVVQNQTSLPYRNWKYLHIQNAVDEHISVVEGQTIAEIFDGQYLGGYDDHVHLVYVMDGFLEAKDNPLIALGAPHQDPGGNKPFIWVSDPNAKRVGYRRQEDSNWGLLDPVRWYYRPDGPVPREPPVIYGDVDIIVKARDYMDGRLANGDPAYPGIYKIGFWVVGPDDSDPNDDLGSAEAPLLFPIFEGRLPEPIQYNKVYYSKYDRDYHIYYYLITNIDKDTDRCWATKAKDGESGTDVDDDPAVKPSEAKFPDGEYSVYVRAWDLLNESEEPETKAVLENYNPIVDETDPPDGAIRSPDPNTVITIWFNERMNEESIITTATPTSAKFTLKLGQGDLEIDIGGSLRYDDSERSAVFTPDSPLPVGYYTATMKDAVRDRYGNKKLDGDADGLEEPNDHYVWNFTVAGQEVYVADRGNGRIQVFDEEGTYIRQFSEGLTEPSAITVLEDNSGPTSEEPERFVYVTDKDAAGVKWWVRKYDCKGNWEAEVSDVFSTDLVGITTDNEWIYVAEGEYVWTFTEDLTYVDCWWATGGIQGIDYNFETQYLYIPHDEPPSHLIRYTTLGEEVPPRFTLDNWHRFDYGIATDDEYLYVNMYDVLQGERQIQGFDLGLESMAQHSGPYTDDILGIDVDDERIFFSLDDPDLFEEDQIVILNKHTPVYTEIGRFGTYGQGPGQFDEPCGIAIYVPPDQDVQLVTSSRSQASRASSNSQMASVRSLLPRVFGLSQNFPNPFQHTTRIPYQLPVRSSVRMEIYNTAGQLVDVLVDEEKDPGYHSVEWGGKDEFGREVSNGVYLSRINAGDFTATKKLVVLR